MRVKGFMNRQLLIGERIRRSREEIGLTQEQLGEKTGYSAMGISLFEKGKRNIKLNDIENFARELGISTSYLLEPMADVSMNVNSNPNIFNFTRYRIDEEIDEDRLNKIKKSENDFNKYIDDNF